MGDAADAALGFRVKSGRAVAVLITGPVRLPRVLDRREIDLCDPAVAASRQPYHAAMGTLQADEAKVARLREIVARAAHQSVAELMKAYGDAGHHVQAAGLVVGSEIDPAKITNPHIRAHALEGRLFRTVLEDALQSHRVNCSLVAERDVYRRAAEALKQSEQVLKRSVTQLGKGLEGPWRADEKTAALAAWLARG
jgi:hypothetical protein